MLLPAGTDDLVGTFVCGTAECVSLGHNRVVPGSIALENRYMHCLDALITLIVRTLLGGAAAFRSGSSCLSREVGGARSIPALAPAGWPVLWRGGRRGLPLFAALPVPRYAIVSRANDPVLHRQRLT